MIRKLVNTQWVRVHNTIHQFKTPHVLSKHFYKLDKIHNKKELWFKRLGLFSLLRLLKTIRKGVESNENFEVHFDSLKLESLI